MGDFDNYAAQAPQTGKTVTYDFFGLRNADGSHPIAHVEWIDDKAWNQHVLSLAGTKDDTGVGKANRDLVARHVKKLEHVFRSDGTAATEDIAKFIYAIPAHDFSRLLAFARNDETYRSYADPEAVAGK
jgi:hypothetical protein